MKYLSQYINETIFDRAEDTSYVDSLVKLDDTLSEIAPKNKDVTEWISYWQALRNVISQCLCLITKRGPIEKNLQIFACVKTLLKSPKYCPIISKFDRFSTKGLTDNNIFCGPVWKKKFDSYQDDLNHNRVASLIYFYPGCLHNEAFEHLDRVLRSDDKIDIALQESYYKKLSIAVDNYLDSIDK